MIHPMCICRYAKDSNAVEQVCGIAGCGVAEYGVAGCGIAGCHLRHTQQGADHADTTRMACSHAAQAVQIYS